MLKGLKLLDGVPRRITYDETLKVKKYTSAGTPVFLPKKGTYNGDELQIRLNDVKIQYGVDYFYVGEAPRNQVVFTFELAGGKEPDKIRFITTAPILPSTV